jgi:single-stranded-DNA-specific exonuclease
MARPQQEPIFWESSKELPKEEFQAARQQGITPIQAQLLHNRGVQTLSEMRTFLDVDYAQTPDPNTLIDMPRAVERILEALAQQEHITVYGDYDADGVTSSALLYRALRTLKQPEAVLDYHIPNRLHDGCGLNLAALDMLKSRGTRLIITTDCGSSDVEQVDYAHSLGIDVIITDHHHPPAELPKAYAMVNPWRSDCTYGERYLCGVGIAFKLTQALYRAYKRTTEEELELLDLVAIGTIADIAPLLGENHTLVRLGLQRVNTTRKPGLRALIQNANLQPGKIRERDIAFGLAPRINAAGRMKEASIAFELLTSDVPEEASARVAELDQLNQNRQQETEELMRNVRIQAEKQPEKSVILVNGDNWHEGIIGLVAGRLAEEINKPVLVLSNDRETQLSRGSARSQKGYNIIAALRTFQGLERYGGHAQAAGFTIRSEDIARLHEHLIRWQEQGLIGDQLENGSVLDSSNDQELPDAIELSASPISINVVTSKIDLTFTSMEKVNYKVYKEIRALSPFGAGNPEPTFKLEGLRLLDSWFSGFNKQNLRLRLGSANSPSQQTGTFTRGAARSEGLAGVKHVDIIFKIESSEDINKQEIWLKILDVVPAVGR